MPQDNRSVENLSKTFAALNVLNGQMQQILRSTHEDFKKVKPVDVAAIFKEKLGVIEGAIRNQLNRSLQNSLNDLLIEGKSFKSSLKQFFTGALNGLIQQSLNINPFSAVKPFARGGILNRPTLFPINGGLGVAGEAGPEAIMPLARGSDGRLGVRVQNGGGQPVSVNINIQTPDLASFQRSQTQTAALIRRAILRGQRNQ